MRFCRLDFIKGGACAAVAASIPQHLFAGSDDPLSVWQKETSQVRPEVYRQYLADGQTNGFATLEKLEAAFEKVVREARETPVADVPAVWSVYNMGYVVKSRKALFAIDLVHRRDAELAQMLDFALVTHNHPDHWRKDFVDAMLGLKKPVVSNFIPQRAGYTRAKRVFKFKDVEIRTSLIDHNEWLIDFTTAFEIRVGGRTLYHTGDSGKGTEPKLETVWGRPDIWLFFPGCGIDVAKAVEKIEPKRIVIGHMWELGHWGGRQDAKKARDRKAKAEAAGCRDVSIAFWGDRIV